MAKRHMDKRVSAIVIAVLLFGGLFPVIISGGHDIPPLMVPSSVQGDGIVDYWAVIICVGFNPHQYVYSKRDAQDLFRVLVRHGWDRDHIKCLVEEEATREAILGSFAWLRESGADADDIIFFYSGTHGYMKDDEPPLDEPDGKDEFIMPFDCDWETDDNCILDDELSYEFDQLASHNMAIFIESCHSGGMLDGTSDLKKPGRVVITCCDVDEVGCPHMLRRHWLFCYYLTKGLEGKANRGLDRWVSAEETYRYVRYPVMMRSTLQSLILFQTVYTQHPQFFDGWPTEDNNEEDLALIQVW